MTEPVLQTRRSYADGEYGGRASAYRYGTGATATSPSPSGPISARNNKDGVVLTCVGPLEGGSHPPRLLPGLACHTREHTSRGTRVFWYHPRGPSVTYFSVSRSPPTWSGAAWSPTSPTSAANSSPPCQKSREEGRTPADTPMWGPSQTDDGVPYVQTGRRRPLVAPSRCPTCIKDRPKRHRDADLQASSERPRYEGEVRTGSEEYGG